MKSFTLKNSIRKITGSAAILLIVFLLTGCREKAEKVTGTDTAMGTMIQQTIYVQGNVNVKERKLTDSVMDEIWRLEEETLSWRIDSSAVSQINQSAGSEEGAEIPEDLAGILDQVWDVSRKSGGALDVTIGDVVRLWKIDDWVNTSASSPDAVFTIPDTDEVMSALKHTGYEKVTFQGNKIFLPEMMTLDLGAVGKGIACDRVAAYLEKREEVTGAVISVGGSILTLGSKPDGSLWNVGIVHPRKNGEYIATLELEGGWFVSTSGDYERFAEADGVRYHHIIDPGDGYPAGSGVVSVTILSRDGMMSDALSTACFVLGVDKGLALAEDMGAEALIISSTGDSYMTEGMKCFLK